MTGCRTRCRDLRADSKDNIRCKLPGYDVASSSSGVHFSAVARSWTEPRCELNRQAAVSLRTLVTGKGLEFNALHVTMTLRCKSKHSQPFDDVEW
ncbi:hypothetical protein chiPu_0007302 [Chiloscyllium punctatum]|uniref:Uncharacterized protein n=1 Tax=Chiloscyllium punctatum TaxID=137246 RepID=A0A401SER2_CHIPU|nr:hypothetical protein [Chiloscyllium punctatum]